MARWAPSLHDLGETEVKSGPRVHVFNLYTDELGNPRSPLRLKKPSATPNFKRLGTIAAATLIVGLLAVAATYFAIKRGKETTSPTVVAAPTGASEYSFKYWLTVQKMRGDKPDGNEIEMTGQEVYGNGWKFRFNFNPSRKGALYLLNEAPTASGPAEFNALFPTPQNGSRPDLDANQKLQTRWYVFDKQTGAEKMWMIWSAAPLADLDDVFRDVTRTQGVLSRDQVATVQKYLSQFDSQRPVVTVDKAQKLTLVKGQGNVIVNLLELSHEAY
jgi:hypothetical protein